MNGIKKAILLILAVLIAGCSDDATKRAAMAGDPKAQFEYALRIEAGNPEEANRLVLLAAAKGNTAAQYHLGRKLIADKQRRDTQEKGFYWLQKAAKGGNLAAQQYLPICHLRGLGTTADPRRAVAELKTPVGDLDLSACVELHRAMDDKTPAAIRTAVLETGVAKDSAECCLLLARHLSTGPNASKDSPRVRELLDKAVAAKHPEAMLLLGYRLINGIGMPPKPHKGIDLLLLAAEAGNHEAACELFWPLNTNRYSRKDPDRAFALLNKAQLAHHPRSYGLMARCYMFGMGTKKDEPKAVEFLRRGATHNDAECLEWLGNIMFAGSCGQQRNVSEALQHLDKAAKLGSVDAYERLFEAYKEIGDRAAARRSLEEGASRGNISCRVYLGMAHAYGDLGITASKAQALPHYLLAAEAGDRYAKYLAGEILISGKEVPKDLTKGVQLLKSAAAGNIYGAQYILAALFSRGVGVPQDAGQAYFWANIAASLNTEDENYSKLRDTLAKKLAAEELTKVQGMCRTWLARKSNDDSNNEETRASGGSGSGIILSSDGLVLTNHHVIAAGKTYTIMTADGKETPATLVAQDADLDVAVLRMQTKYVSNSFQSPPPLVSSSKAKSGEKVFTVGHPLAGILSVEPKYNEGTISALSGMQDDLHTMQISVPIQPGNSGGPLANARGEIIGIIVSTIDGGALLRQRDIMAQNINFAIKADPVREFLRANSIALPSYPSPTDPVEHVKSFAVKVIVTP